MNKISFFVFLVCIFLLKNIYAQNKQDKQLSNQLDQLLSERFKPTELGCAVLITKKER